MSFKSSQVIFVTLCLLDLELGKRMGTMLWNSTNQLSMTKPHKILSTEEKKSIGETNIRTDPIL